MITSKDIFHVVLNDDERDKMYKELIVALPQMTKENARKFPLLYKLRSELREEIVNN